MLSKRQVAVGIAGALAALSSVARGQASDDLSRAIAAGGGRIVTRAPEPRSGTWLDLSGGIDGGPSALKIPFSICWRGPRLVVADRELSQLTVFDDRGSVVQTIGSHGSAPGQFAQVTDVECSSGPTAYMAADQPLHRLSFFDSAGRLLRMTRTPRVPQIDVMGAFALGDDGTWYDSWLGSDIGIGPFLSKSEWSAVRLVTAHTAADSSSRGIGNPVVYSDPVATRVFNHVSLTVARDTLWVLTQADATIYGFTRTGVSAGTPIRLPIYFRGIEPKVKVDEGARHPPSEFVPNELVYEPNVLGLATLADSLFVTIRYRDWRMKLMGKSGVSLDRVPESSIEVVDRSGRVVAAFDAPGYVLSVATDGGSRVAIITRMRDNTRHVLISSVRF